jgi:GT2 family glycosyltransferase
MLFLKGDALRLTRYSPDRPRPVDWVSGACLMAQKKVFEDGLLFDENIFMYMDEIDLLFRAKMKGYRTYFFPSAKFIHVGSGSAVGRKQPVLNIYHGLVYFYRKHYGGVSIFLLRTLLKLKAVVAVAIGELTGNVYLKETYNEAYRLA